MDNSKIEWTESTFNPWIGCTKVSPACRHCYAETLMAQRWGRVKWGAKGTRQRTTESTWKKPITWNRQAAQERKRRRVFCASVADVFETFEGRDPKGNQANLDDWRKDLFALIDNCPHLDWLILTKRPENARAFFRLHGARPNIWLGVSAENQEHWDQRVGILMDTPATIRFVSAEPLLSAINMRGLRPDWVIVGGESGGGFREMDPDWARSMRDQCKRAGTAFFFKQWSGFSVKKLGRELDGKVWDELPAAPAKSLNIRSKHSGLPRIAIAA